LSGSAGKRLEDGDQFGRDKEKRHAIEGCGD